MRPADPGDRLCEQLRDDAAFHESADGLPIESELEKNLLCVLTKLRRCGDLGAQTRTDVSGRSNGSAAARHGSEHPGVSHDRISCDLVETLDRVPPHVVRVEDGGPFVERPFGKLRIENGDEVPSVADESRGSR